MVTPVARRRVATFAKEIVTLDHLSSGRVNVGIGLGFPDDEYTGFGEPADMRRRGEITDEMIEVLPKLWSGEPVKYDGTHVHVDAHMRPPTVQQPHPPIWIGCLWPNPAPSNERGGATASCRSTARAVRWRPPSSRRSSRHSGPRRTGSTSSHRWDTRVRCGLRGRRCHLVRRVRLARRRLPRPARSPSPANFQCRRHRSVSPDRDR